MKKWIAVDYDVSRKLTAEMKTECVEIPAGLKLQIVVELDDTSYAKLVKDATWVQKIQQKANAKAVPAIDFVKKTVRDIDVKAGKFDPKVVATFSADLNNVVKKQLDGAGKEMAAEVNFLLKEYSKGQKDLLKFQAKAGVVIAMKSVQIGMTTAAAVASHGALTPLAIVGIAKNSVAIANECAKLALSADQAAVLIDKEFAILKKFMIEDLAKAKAMGKIAQGVKEAGLNIIAGALGVPIPSLATAATHIQVHKAGIAKLDAKSKGLSEGLYKAMDVQENWNKKYQAAKKSMPADKVSKIDAQSKKAETALDAMIEATIAVNERVASAQDRQVRYEKTLSAMKGGLPSLALLQSISSLGVSLGTDLGAATHKLQEGLAILQVSETIVNGIT